MPGKKLPEIHPKLKSAPIPTHIAIIMDGNGRWAKSKHKPRVFGHRQGVHSVRDVVEACGELGIQYLTLYAFSTENWKRPQNEVSTLMRLLVTTLRQEVDKLHENNVRLIAIGDLNKLPKDAQNELHEAMEKTGMNTGLTLNLALSYSSRWDIVHAIRCIATDVRNGLIPPDDIDEDTIASYLSTASLPDPDLLIRTSGEMRLSNFLLWELAYTEFYISERYWPDFRRADLYEAIRSFQQRERRYGQVSEQLQSGGRRAAVKDKRVNAVPNHT